MGEPFLPRERRYVVNGFEEPRKVGGFHRGGGFASGRLRERSAEAQSDIAPGAEQDRSANRNREREHDVDPRPLGLARSPFQTEVVARWDTRQNRLWNDKCMERLRQPGMEASRFHDALGL